MQSPTKPDQLHEPGKPTRQVARSEDQRIKLPQGVIPAIIDAETFMIVQQQLQRNKQNAERNNQHPESALLRCGYAKCGYCRYYHERTLARRKQLLQMQERP